MPPVFIDDGRNDLQWSQVEVILVSYGTNIPKNQSRQACYKAGDAIMVLWGKIREETRQSVSCLSACSGTKWNPVATHIHSSWSFDVEKINKYFYSYIITRMVIKVITIEMITSVT